MNCCNYNCDDGIVEVTSVSKVSKKNFLKSAEVKFYIKKFKNTSDLKLGQLTNSLSRNSGEQLNLIIIVSNIGPDKERNGKLVEMLSDENILDIEAIVLSKGTYSLDYGLFIWDIGEIAPSEQLFAIISVKPKKSCICKSIAAIGGENSDPEILNNFSVERIMAVDIDSIKEKPLIYLLVSY